MTNTKLFYFSCGLSILNSMMFFGVRNNEELAHLSGLFVFNAIVSVFSCVLLRLGDNSE